MTPSADPTPPDPPFHHRLIRRAPWAPCERASRTPPPCAAVGAGRRRGLRRVLPACSPPRRGIGLCSNVGRALYSSCTLARPLWILCGCGGRGGCLWIRCGSHCLGRHPPRLSLHTTYCEGGIASTHTTSSVLILALRTHILCTFLESSCARLGFKVHARVASCLPISGGPRWRRAGPAMRTGSFFATWTVHTWAAAISRALGV